jgi:purine-nucleoside phosphorylase
VSDPLGPFAGAASVAVVLGSGLAGLCDGARIAYRVPYRDLPPLLEPAVEGHPGFLALADFGGRPALLFAGRSHLYEGQDPARVTAAVSLAADLGCTELVLTNAAGSLTAGIRPGAWLLPEDVIAFPARRISRFASAGRLSGGARLSPLIAPRLRESLRRAAREAGTAVEDGVLAWMSGPCFETAAEARAAAAAGAHAATMSVYPELVAARFRGIDAAVLSLITNDTAGVSRGSIDHADVMKRGAEGGRRLAAIIGRLLASRGDA